MNNITLQKIDAKNYMECFRLQLAPGQEKYVSSPIRSLAQAYVYYKQCTPFGIYAGDQMVGYVMVIYDDEEETYNIWHLMIDQQFQGKGYGKGAMQEALAYIRTKPFGISDTVLMTCNPENEIAYHLYQQLGFRETGRRDEEEVELARPIAGK